MHGLGSTYSTQTIFAVIVVAWLTGFVGTKQPEELPQTTEQTSSANLLQNKAATDQTDNVPYEITKSLFNVTTTTMGSEHPAPEALSKDDSNEYTAFCPSGVQCSKLGGECINCDFNMTCEYGKDVTVSCRAKRNIHCVGEKEFKRTMNCRYCYQTPKWQHSCKGSPNCRVVSAPREKYLANCTVSSEVVCLGNRKFLKRCLCNWTAGYRWTTTLVLSITLGGFGADRFYLGHWQEGIGKLFSFGGLGVWTLIDVILIAIGYLGPADGSLYIW